jgi:P27 family predicted phage terminase small subunit
MARRPTPSHLKVVAGTNRKDRENPDEPKPALGSPVPPVWLSDDAKVQWGRFSVWLEQMGVLTVADGPALERLVSVYLEVRDLEACLTLEGRTYATQSTVGERVVKAHPAVAMLNSADSRLRQMLIEFGLTPAARTKVHTVQRGGKQEPEKQKPASAYFKG